MVMGMISVKRSTPTPSLIVSCLMSLGMLITSDVYELINYFSFTLWLWTGIATASLVHLRRTRPELKRPIQFPLILPYSFTAGCFILTLFAIHADPKSALYGSSLMFVGIPVYFLQRNLIKRSHNNNSSGKALPLLA
jgi:L-type amino acid transporter 8